MSKPTVRANDLRGSLAFVLSDLLGWNRFEVKIRLGVFCPKSTQLINLLLLVFGLLNLAACQAQSEMLGTPISGYNHTSSNINRFTVNGGGGPNIGPHQGGLSSQTCCATLPRTWTPGLKAVVEWESDPAPRAAIKRDKYGQIGSNAYTHHAANYTHHKEIVDVTSYGEKFCAIQVHFLPCDKVRVSTTCFAPNHPKYPDHDYFQLKGVTICLTP